MTRVLVFVASVLWASPVVASVLDSLNRSDVRVATHLRQVDPGALAALKRQFSDDHGRLADRGARFEATDVVGPFPERRLILAVQTGDTWFFHYEHGGRGYHTHLVALTRADHSWRLAYAAAAFYVYASLPKLRAAVQAHQFEKTDDL